MKPDQDQNKELFLGPMHQTKLAIISLRSTGSIWWGKKWSHQLHQPNLCQMNNSTQTDLKRSYAQGRDTWEPLTNPFLLLDSSSIQSLISAVSKPETKCRKEIISPMDQRTQYQQALLQQACQTNWLGRVRSTWSIWWGKKFCHHTCLVTSGSSPARAGNLLVELPASNNCIVKAMFVIARICWTANPQFRKFPPTGKCSRPSHTVAINPTQLAWLVQSSFKQSAVPKRQTSIQSQTCLCLKACAATRGPGQTIWTGLLRMAMIIPFWKVLGCKYLRTQTVSSLKSLQCWNYSSSYTITKCREKPGSTFNPSTQDDSLQSYKETTSLKTKRNGGSDIAHPQQVEPSCINS